MSSGAIHNGPVGPVYWTGVVSTTREPLLIGQAYEPPPVLRPSLDAGLSQQGLGLGWAELTEYLFPSPPGLRPSLVAAPEPARVEPLPVGRFIDLEDWD